MPLKDLQQIRTTVLPKNAIKVERKIGPVFGPFYRYATQGVHQKLEYSPGAQHFGISVAKRAAVPALHVPISGLRCRIKALGVVPEVRRNPPQAPGPRVLPADQQQVKPTSDSRADEAPSFQPLLLGSDDEIILRVHGTSLSLGGRICLLPSR